VSRPVTALGGGAEAWGASESGGRAVETWSRLSVAFGPPLGGGRLWRERATTGQAASISSCRVLVPLVRSMRCAVGVDCMDLESVLVFFCVDGGD
jgi:hypothetical protein